jgi:hypothetical protein
MLWQSHDLSQLLQYLNEYLCVSFMFRQITAILLIVSFAAQTFNQALIVLDYYTNNASYSKNCINKARPVMHCNGKCQMMKKLKAEEKKEQQVPDKKYSNKNELVCSGSFFITLAVIHPPGRLKILLYNSNSFPSGLSDEIFHPPGII